jgi:signal peptidase I
VGDYIFTTNLKTPERFDFITYRMKDSMYGKQIWVHRLCGLPGDRIEIKNDTLFLNGENADKGMNLRKYFVIPSVDPEQYGISIEDVAPIESGDSVIAVLQTKKDSALIKKGRPHIESSDRNGDPFISKIYHQPWTASNFGPYIVPLGKYFVLGDNRLASQDSRYTGPLDMSQYVGTVLGRK